MAEAKAEFPVERRTAGAAETAVSREEPAPAGAGAPVEEPDLSPAVEADLPSMDELVKRIPPEVLATMDELFRAKWTAVRRLQPGDLKNG